MIDRRPNLAGYARVSYVRELRGDLPGAVEAMRLAVAAGGPARGERGLRERAARRAGAAPRPSRRGATGLRPGARAGPGPRRGGAGPRAARLATRAATRRSAAARLVERLPLPEYVIALGEAQLAAGKPAQRTFALVTAQRRLLDAAGVDTDVELAVFEADHGDPEQAVALARSGYASGAERTRRGRARVGADPRRQAESKASGTPASAAPRRGRPTLARPRGTGRGGRGEGAGDEHSSARWTHGLDGWPWQAQRVRRALR